MTRWLLPGFLAVGVIAVILAALALWKHEEIGRFRAVLNLFKPDHITLLNIAADDQEIVPEFVQTKFKAGPMADIAVNRLTDADARERQIDEQKKALSAMGEGNLNSAQIAAEVLLGRD